MIKDLDQTEIDLIVEEFKALRAEIVLCLERRVTIISFGLTAIAILTGAAVTSLNGNASRFLPSAVILGLMVPERHRVKVGRFW